MVLSKGLLISLGFTLLIGVLLFMFIKQKTNHIEGKMTALFNIVQEEAEKNQKRQIEMRQNNMMISEVRQQQSEDAPEMSQSQAQAQSQEQSSRLITVSDDSESEEDDNESIEEGSDVDSETESESEQEESQEESREALQTSVNNLEKEFNSQTGGNVEIKYVKVDQEEDLERQNIHMMMMSAVDPTIVTLMPDDMKDDSARVTLVEDDEDDEDESDESDLGSDIDELTLSDDEAPITIEPEQLSQTLGQQPEQQQEQPQQVSNESKVIAPTQEFMNYSKLSVKVLREIVASKGLHPEPSKIKKKELLKVLEQS